MLRSLLLVVVSLCLGVVAGCGDTSGPRTVNASGVVTLDGAPVEKATVVFINEGTQTSASAITDSQGRFSLMHNGEKKGAVPGDYKVQVNKTLLSNASEDGADVTINHGLPKKYASVVTSGMTQNVPESGIDNIQLSLTSK